MEYPELEKLGKEERNAKLEEMIEKKLAELSEDPSVEGTIYSAGGIFFKISGGEIIEMSSYGEDTARGAGSLDVFRGLSKETNAALSDILEKYDIDTDFFSEAMKEFDCLEDEDFIDYFRDPLDDDEDDEEDEEDEEGSDEEGQSEELKTVLAIKKAVDNGEIPFECIYDLAQALPMYGTDSNTLYYEWEGEIMELEDTLIFTGSSRGEYESFSPERWLEILNDLSSYTE